MLWIKPRASLLYKRNGTAWNYLRRIEHITAQAEGAFGYASAIEGLNMMQKGGSVFS